MKNYANYCKIKVSTQVGFLKAKCLHVGNTKKTHQHH